MSYKTLYFLSIASCLVFATHSAIAQEGRTTDYNSIGWLMYTGTFRMGTKVSLHTEYQERKTGIVKYQQQQLIRTGINYRAGKNLSFQAGYAFARSYPYGSYPAASAFPEHRSFQQITLRNNIGKTDVSHRFTLEQRFVANANRNEKWLYLNRTRYRLRLERSLYKKFTVGLQDELFIGWGKNIGVNMFDQNRLFIFSGYTANEHIKFEAGYINQILQQSKTVNGRSVFQHNNGFVVAGHLNLSIWK